MKNAANHTAPATRTAWTVSYPANIFDDVDAGAMVHEFNSKATAEKVAREHGVQVVERERNTYDMKPGTKQDGVDGDDVTQFGRWSGRMYERKFGITWNYIELKINGELVWLNAS